MSNKTAFNNQMYDVLKKASTQDVEPAAMTNSVLVALASEVAGLNDELHAINLNLKKLTNEVGKRK